MAELIVGAIAGWVGTKLGLAGAALLLAKVFAIGAYRNHQQRRAERRARDAYNASLTDRTVMVDVQADAPRTNGTVPQRLYATGPDVAMLAKSTPGGRDGADNGFGLLKYLAGIPGGGTSVPTSGINFDFPISGGGNDGIIVVDLPDFDVAGGGTKTQILDYSSYFVQKAEAGYLIQDALDATNTTDYGTSLSY